MNDEKITFQEAIKMQVMAYDRGYKKALEDFEEKFNILLESMEENNEINLFPIDIQNLMEELSKKLGDEE